jgi:DNA-binding GntR family transcriptional regulator
MNLNNQEKALILELARNPVFTDLMQKISADTRQVRKWRKGDDEDAKHHEWIYSSGVVEGRDYVLKLLRYENERPSKAG